MIRTQVQFPDPLYRRLKAIAKRNDWPLAEVVRRATELYVRRFPEPDDEETTAWTFPLVDAGGDFLIDPAEVNAEADAVVSRLR